MYAWAVIRQEPDHLCILEQQTVDSPFEIDVKGGTLKFPQVLLTLAPQRPLAVFLATEVGASAQRERGNNEWQLYSLRRDLVDGRKLGVTLTFTNGCLAQARFDYRPERETDWSSWSQERELARANDYRAKSSVNLESADASLGDSLIVYTMTKRRPPF